MIILLGITNHSIFKASLIQIVIFSIVHIKGLTSYHLIDSFSVAILAIAFTFLAIKTRSLWPAIIFHFLHDTFVLFATSSAERSLATWEQLVLFIPMWIGIALAILITGKLIRQFEIVGESNIYGLTDEIKEEEIPKQKVAKSNSIKRRVLFINMIGLSIILLLSEVESSYTFLFYFFNILFILTNLFLLVFLEKLGEKVNMLIMLFTGVVAFFTSYDYYVQGSQTVYLIWLILGLIYLLLAFRKKTMKSK